MNKKKAFELLKEYLNQFARESFVFHSRFVEEFEELIYDAKGMEKEIFALLIKQLSFVKQLKMRVHLADSNEKLMHQTGEYYSLHLKGKNFNLRLLLAFGKNGNPVFLAAFYEREGKRATDYSKIMPVLETRFNELRGENYEK